MSEGRDGVDERISCLMVTQPVPQRWDWFRRSVACFLNQTYPNRELVVVFDEGPPDGVRRLREHLEGLPGVGPVVQLPGRRPLGALRNVSVRAASGAVLCQWDDDDLYHPTRLAEQHRLLKQEGALASGLQEVLHFFPDSRQLYWTSFHHFPGGFFPGSVMFRREAAARYLEDGPDSRRGEDSFFLLALKAQGKLAPLAGAAHLYVYVYHGANTWDAQHHRGIVGWSAVSRGMLHRRRRLLEGLGCLDLGEGPIDVMGSNGLAFRLDLTAPAVNRCEGGNG